MRKGIICGGNLVVDLVKVIENYPEEGMLSSILSEKRNGGGAPFNVLVNLAIMDPTIPLFAAGLIGDDDYGKYYINEISKYNIDCRMITVDSNYPTSYTDVMSSNNNGSRTFFHRKGTNALLDIEHFNNLVQSAKIFHLGYLMLLDKLDSKDEKFGTKSARLLSKIKDNDMITCVDMVSVNNNNFREIIEPSLSYIDYLIINEIEAEKSTGIKTRIDNKLSEDAVFSAAEELINIGVKQAVVIHAPEGGFLLDNNKERYIQKSDMLESKFIKGTVGAGDAFCSGMLYSIHEEYDYKTALKIANSSAWFNLQDETSTGGAVSLSKILNRI